MSEIINILGNASMAHSNMDINIDTTKIINDIFKIIEEDKEGIVKANQIDLKNNNGFEIDFSIIETLKEKFLTMADSYRNIISMTKDTKNNYIYGTQTDKLGTICLVYDGNTYNLIEMVLKCILTHNAIILASETNYMMGTNELVIILIQRILESYNIDKNLVQFVYTNQFDELLKNNISINKVIVIGNHDLHLKVKKSSQIETVYLGYGNCDIYIEDNAHKELIESILQKANNLTVYVKEGIDINYEDSILVYDVNEAIGEINCNTSGYSSSIFTEDTDNATLFLKDVKTDNVAVNASPIYDNFTNVNLSLLLKNKNMYYPNPLNENGDNNKFEFPTERAIIEKKKEEKVKKEIENLKNENIKLKANNEEIENTSTMKLSEKDKEIQELKKQLSESQQLVNKYIKIFQKSTFSRIFGKLSKEDIEKDMKLLS